MVMIMIFRIGPGAHSFGTPSRNERDVRGALSRGKQLQTLVRSTTNKKKDIQMVGTNRSCIYIMLFESSCMVLMGDAALITGTLNVSIGELL